MSDYRTTEYKPTKLVLYKVVPALIEAYRIPGDSDDSPGRRQGKANLDEQSGACDVLYHLMCTDSIAFMSGRLGVSRKRLYDALDACMHTAAPHILEQIKDDKTTEKPKPFFG